MKRVIVSAGDAITARIVDEFGFDGIWVSGFEVSARMGLPDNGSLTMTEMLQVVKPIVDASRLPVFVDVDTGYGNLKRTVREFERIGVYAICIEDNIPELKQNSLWGDKIDLMDSEKFGNKLLSVKNRDIKIIARTEALIRGYGKGEALKRIFHYWKCGADFVLPHVRDEKDLLNFDVVGMEFAIVPTKFPHFTNEMLFKMGYSLVIWANQTERVKIKSIREALDVLKKDDCAVNIESNLSATLDDMRGLIGNV